MKQPASLIFDIGKTAKKVLVFDEDFAVADEKVEHFKEIKDEDNFPSEDLQSVSEWVKEMVARYLSHPQFEIKHINFSAYGASLVNLDQNDLVIGRFYNYLKPFPDEFKFDFLSLYDRDDSLSAVTASPWLGMLNSGLQLFWMKREKQKQFEKIETVLHLPQYFSFLLTGKKFSEITSIGCHTMLWNFQQNTYHRWVEQENLVKFFPPLKNSGHTTIIQSGSNKIKAGIGVHDSSAALMPYLVTQQEPFLLLSTGTWNIAFNPFNHQPLTKDELKKDCLCYLTFHGKPVKASRIFLGHEHEMQVNSMAGFFKADPEFYANLKFDQKIYDRLSTRSAEKIIYSLGMEGSGPMPDKELRKTSWQSFETIEEAYHQMVRYLIRWQLISLDLIDPHHAIKNLIAVGGFTKNQIFLQILKREARHLKIYLSDHPRAAALGAAWLVSGVDAYQRKKDLLNVRPL